MKQTKRGKRTPVTAPSPTPGAAVQDLQAPPPQPRLPKAWGLLKRWNSLFLVAAVLAPLAFGPANDAIRSDGAGYHMWTRAILERDFTFCKWDLLRKVGAITHFDPVRNICQMKYPPGLALLRFPIMAPFVDLRPGAPLISPAEHRAALLFGHAALLSIVWFTLATAALAGVPAWTANFSALVFVFGTGLFNYATFDGGFVHIYDAALISLLAWLGAREFFGRKPASPWLAAITVFFLASMRSTNFFVLAFLFALDLLFRWKQQGGVSLRDLVKRYTPSMAAILLAVAIQVGYNYYATHQLAYSSYGAETFRFDHPMQGPVLFSYVGGLYTYYPVALVALAVGLWVRSTRWITVWFAGLTATFTTLYGFWDDWGLKASMGHRGFVDILPLAAMIFPASLAGLRPRFRAFVVACAALCTFATIEFTRGYWALTLPWPGPTRIIYWEHVAGRYSLLYAWAAWLAHALNW